MFKCMVNVENKWAQNLPIFSKPCGGSVQLLFKSRIGFTNSCAKAGDCSEASWRVFTIFQ